MIPRAWYRLPGGALIPVDDTAAKGASVIEYTLADGTIVRAVRALVQTSAGIRQNPLLHPDTLFVQVSR